MWQMSALLLSTLLKGDQKLGSGAWDEDLYRIGEGKKVLKEQHLNGAL